MTTIFEETEEGKPHTHIFIVGVGAYRHLEGGTGPLLDDPMGMKQLTSPPISAKAFADWILKHFNNPDASLGSVELLLSPADFYVRPNDGQQIDVEAATMANIEIAFNRWYQRCDTHEKNIALFYFCGHGVMKENLALLVEDFGNNPHQLFKNAIDFHRTHRGMAKCRAKTQCYFIDSCRQVPFKMLNLLEVNATVLVDSSVLCQPPKDAKILYASARNQRAYGLQNQITRFTEALIKGFEGLGSRHENERWVVTTSRLAEAVIKTVERENDAANRQVQECREGGEGLGTSVIHVLNTPPSVPVSVGFEPPNASALAHAHLSLLKHSQVTYSRVPQQGDWKFTAPVGEYTVCAHFPAGRYCDFDDEDLLVYPPYADRLIKVKEIL